MLLVAHVTTPCDLMVCVLCIENIILGGVSLTHERTGSRTQNIGEPPLVLNAIMVSNQVR